MSFLKVKRHVSEEDLQLVVPSPDGGECNIHGVWESETNRIGYGAGGRRWVGQKVGQKTMYERIQIGLGFSSSTASPKGGLNLGSRIP